MNLCFLQKNKKIGGIFFLTRIQPNKIVIKAKTVIFLVKYSFKPESYN